MKYSKLYAVLLASTILIGCGDKNTDTPQQYLEPINYAELIQPSITPDSEVNVANIELEKALDAVMQTPQAQAALKLLNNHSFSNNRDPRDSLKDKLAAGQLSALKDIPREEGSMGFSRALIESPPYMEEKGWIGRICMKLFVV